MKGQSKNAMLHMGRVNSVRRLQAAWDIGCDSVDGTGVSMYGDTLLEWFIKNLRRIEMQPLLGA